MKKNRSTVDYFLYRNPNSFIVCNTKPLHSAVPRNVPTKPKTLALHALTHSLTRSLTQPVYIPDNPHIR